MRFGETDSPLDERGRADVEESVRGWSITAPVICGPERATRETAALLSPAVIVDAGLAGINVGKWAGRLPEEIPGAELRAWFADPTARPHGGETVVEFVDRIVEWIRGAPDVAVLVVSGPVAQALRCDDASSFFTADVVPGRRYRLG